MWHIRFVFPSLQWVPEARATVDGIGYLQWVPRPRNSCGKACRTSVLLSCALASQVSAHTSCTPSRRSTSGIPLTCSRVPARIFVLSNSPLWLAILPLVDTLETLGVTSKVTHCQSRRCWG